MIKLILFLILPVFCSGSGISNSTSYNRLFEGKDHIHPTMHITNIIRNGISSFNNEEKEKLATLGLVEKNGTLNILSPTFLEMIHETEHFRIHYTTEQSSSHKIENFDYVQQMGEVFEQVWLFFIDTLEFNNPIIENNYENNFYDIYIENLPSYYFGITYATNSGSSLNQCSSFIKMRNNYNGSQFSSHSQLENIKVTAVHEFFHAIQFSYNCFEQLWIMEASAVWSEDQLYNGINDLYRYLNSWFSNSDLPLNYESSHMYGSFIFFQYLDEHFGGTETIRKVWDYSKENASSSTDISFQAIDFALKSEQLNFREAYHKMTVSNRILDELVQTPYSYIEANGYKTVTSGPNSKENIIFKEKDFKQINNQTLKRFSTCYYSLSIDSPVKVDLSKNSGDFSMSVIIKHNGINRWTIKSDYPINIDPSIDIEWISIVISALGFNGNNWDFTLNIEDGFSEDFTLSLPFPNPNYGNDINFYLEVFNNQKILITINDVLGRGIWMTTKNFIHPEATILKWNGLNQIGRKVSNGVYFITAEGISSKKTHKVILLKALK